MQTVYFVQGDEGFFKPVTEKLYRGTQVSDEYEGPWYNSFVLSWNGVELQTSTNFGRMTATGVNDFYTIFHYVQDEACKLLNNHQTVNLENIVKVENIVNGLLDLHQAYMNS